MKILLAMMMKYRSSISKLILDSKICKDCNRLLPGKNFYRNKTGYYASYCKKCEKIRAAENYQNNIGDRRKKRKAWHKIEKNMRLQVDYNKKWKAKKKRELEK